MVDVLCIVQARLTSTRLPNKVLLPLGNSELSILEHVNQRLNQSKCISAVVFAIPDTPLNDKLADFLGEKEIVYFRGSEENVLERFYQCASEYKPRLVVRATCDNPLVDWQLIDLLVKNIGQYDYISCKETPLGTSVEVFTYESLRNAYNNATMEPQKEHVTPYIQKYGDSFLLAYNGLKYRLTIDEDRDYYVVNTIYKDLYKGNPIPNRDVYEYLSSHQDIATYNQEVHQKQIGE